MARAAGKAPSVEDDPLGLEDAWKVLRGPSIERVRSEYPLESIVETLEDLRYVWMGLGISAQHEGPIGRQKVLLDLDGGPMTSRFSFQGLGSVVCTWVGLWSEQQGGELLWVSEVTPTRLNDGDIFEPTITLELDPGARYLLQRAFGLLDPL